MTAPHLRDDLTEQQQRRRVIVGIVAFAAIVAIGAGTFAFVAGGHHTSRTPRSRDTTRTSTTATPQAIAVIGGPQEPPGTYGPTAPWVEAENNKPGTAAWALTKPARHHEIEGFLASVSINDGNPVALFVSTTAPTFHVEAYRMGFYDNLGARLIWTSPDTPGTVQPPFKLTPTINMVEDVWQPSLTIQTTTNAWPPGDYLFKLVAATGWESYAPLTIRDDASNAAYVVNNSVTTWQAYNLYGGYDLYSGPSGFGSRARVVSFDRPYSLGDGSGDFLGNEVRLVALVESLGLDVTYTTDVDIDEHPDALLHHKAFVSLGHDEYYSLAMRNGLAAARDHGLNLAFLGANAAYRHIRFDSSPLGPDRHEIDYKTPAEDPLTGKDDADVTPYAWRDPPNNNPESTLVGDYYDICQPGKGDIVIDDPSTWVFAGTGITSGTHLQNLIQGEYDRFDPSAPLATGAQLKVLAHSPVTCAGQRHYSDITYYSVPSGAGVFASGTARWVPLLNPSCPLPCSGAPLVRITENVLAAFGTGPAAHQTQQHPSSPAAAGP